MEQPVNPPPASGKRESAPEWARLPDTNEISALSAQGVASNLAAKVAVQLINLGALMVLARVLRPEDFGLVAIVFSTVGVAELLRDLGLSAATMRAPKLTESQLNSMFWLNFGFGVFATCVCIVFAGSVGRWYGDPRLAGLTALLSVNFLVNGFATQHMALLRRRMQLSLLARNSVFASLATQLVVLSAAFAGFSYWALAFGSVTGTLVTALLAYQASGWRASRPQFHRSTLPLVRFGGHLVIFGLLSYAAQNLHNVLIGAMWGAAAAGLYHRALTTLQMLVGYVLDPAKAVGAPALARLNERPDEFRELYLGLLRGIMLAAAPLGMFLVLEGRAVVEVLLGGQWGMAGDLLRLLAIGTIAQVLCFSTGWVYLARGDARGMMRWGAASWSVVIGALFVASQFGASTMAAMYSASMWLLLIPCLYFACRTTTVRLADIAARCWRPVCAAVLGAACLYVLGPALGAIRHPWVNLGLQALAYGVLYLSWLLLVLREPVKIRDTFARLRSLRSASGPNPLS